MTDSSENADEDIIPWPDLSESERRNFARLLNNRFGASVSVEEAEEYYRDRKKAVADFGVSRGRRSGPVECPECFASLTRDDIPHLKQTGECPYCGEVLGT